MITQYICFTHLKNESLLYTRGEGTWRESWEKDRVFKDVIFINKSMKRNLCGDLLKRIFVK
jgi:hypothetical protein